MKRLWLALAAMLALAAPLAAQTGAEAPPAAATLVRAKADPVTISAGGAAIAVVHLAIVSGWHVNANPPALEYNIPTTIVLAPAGGLRAEAPQYPAPDKRKFAFSDDVLWVWDGAVDVRVPIAADVSAPAGATTLAGEVRFQACNDQVCLAPAKVAFTLPVTVRAGTPAPAAGGGAPTPRVAPAPAAAPAAGFATAPPPGAAAAGSARSRLAGALARGGLAWFLALFAGGLLLNLTPCVFPMLGITVSIFGARRQEPLPRVLAWAVLYVLGIAVMYSALGVGAALTGSLFGAALQSPWVNVGLGALLVVLSLSMFGLYQLQPPAWLLDRLGGAQGTSAAGIFLSGLGVGVIAAPCVGPFVVAVLAVIAQRGNAVFGLQTMFTLSLGLGFPYLFLATFSNLLQRLPRSGGWMIWVEKAFGVLLAAIGLFYVLNGVAGRLSPWVLPAGLLLGGLYLGFMEKSADERRGFRAFKRVAGGAAVIAGVAMVLGLVSASARTLTFRDYDERAVAASLAAGRPVMLDFSADWCVPCHELELGTFTDRRVVSAAQSFDRFHVDLTQYDSEASERTRRHYGVTGVPTIVFLRPGGDEARDARVEGYLAAAPFLDRLRAAAVR